MEKPIGKERREKELVSGGKVRARLAFFFQLRKERKIGRSWFGF